MHYKLKLRNGNLSYSQKKSKKFDNLPLHIQNSLFFLSAQSGYELSLVLKISIANLQRLISNRIFDYTHYTIPKKKGGERHIFAPGVELKRVQKKLNHYLQAYYLSIKPSQVNGFIPNPSYWKKNCNILENAKPHTNKLQVLNIDLKDFFPSISAAQVKQLLASDKFNFDDNTSTAIALLCTFKGALPIGAPTSPVLSNFICLPLDNALIEFCKLNNLNYTRYADDLTFSSDFLISQDTQLDIILIIQQHKFKINEKKLRLKSAHQKQEVTGLTVNKKVNVNRALLKKVRAMLHDLTINGIDAATLKHFHFKPNVLTNSNKELFVYRLKGYINFIGQIRGKSDPIYIKYKNSFDRYFESIKAPFK